MYVAMDISLTPWLSLVVYDLVRCEPGTSSCQVIDMPTKTCKCVDTIDIHRTRATNTLAAASAECQCWVDFILDPDESIKHHGSRLVQVECI